MSRLRDVLAALSRRARTPSGPATTPTRQPAKGRVPGHPVARAAPPLNAILGWVSLLRDQRVEAARIPKVLEIVARNAQSQAQLISDVLDVSRVITGRLRLACGRW